ncbi:MAG: MMPL family transporter, partial [Acidimicrobiales bacterium]|nr:MMPL family transporter [Acidimicrobiales bacterium]
MKVGRWCYRRRGVVVGAWIAVLFIVGGIGQAVGVDFGGDPEAPESESRTGFEILDENFGGTGAGFGGTIVFQAEQGFDAPEVQAAFTEITDEAAAVDGVDVQLPGAPGAINQVATDGDQAGKIAYARVEIGEDLTFEESGELGSDLRETADRLESEVDGLRIEIGGEPLAGFEPPSSEVIGLAFAIVVLIVSFGSVLAMGLPIAVALAGVTLGITLTHVVILRRATLT